MGSHDLPSEIKAQEIGKTQDQYLLFKNRLKSDQSVKSKGILEPKNISPPESIIFVPDNIESHDMPLDVGQSSESSPGIPDTELSETEDSIWNESLHKEEQAQFILPAMPPAASVMETPQNVPWSNHPAPSQTDQTSSYSAFEFHRTDTDTDFEMGQNSASRKV